METNNHNSGSAGEHREGGPDAHLDANLRAIGARMGALPSPSEAQIRSWRGERAADAPALRLSEAAGGDSTVRTLRPRRSRWLAAGSAIAACVAIGTAIFLQPWGSTVQASTIINGLRNKTFGGVNLRFDHVSSRGTTVDGMIRVRLDTPVSIETLDDAHALDGKDHFGAAYGKFTITTDDTVPGWAGGRIEAEGALTRGSGWMYLLASDKTVKQLAAAEPRAMGLASMAGTGVLLNIGGVDEPFFEGLHAMMCPGECAGGPMGKTGLHASVQTTPDGHGTVSVGMSARVPGEPGGRNAPSMEQMQRFASLARMLLSGKARQGELDQLKGMIQNDFAQQANVRKLSGGQYLLTADLPDPEAPAGATSPGATLRVCYEEAAGVQWAEIVNMRDTTGTVRIEFFDTDPIDPALLQYGRLVETGKTNYLDLRQVMRFFMPVAKQIPGLLIP
jgi:hypothetical protein